jgi:hypothetical protein
VTFSKNIDRQKWVDIPVIRKDNRQKCLIVNSCQEKNTTGKALIGRIAFFVG